MIRRIVLSALVVAVLSVAIAPVRTRVLPWTLNRLVEQTLLEWPPWGARVVTPPAGEALTVPAGDGRSLPAERHRATSGASRGRVVLVHGSIAKGRRFGPYRHLATAFAARGFDVIVPDIGGYGEAPIAPDAVPTFGADVAAVVRAVADEGDAPIAIVGHSLGAAMALDAVVTHGVRPDALVLWDPPLDIPTELEAANRARFLARRRAELNTTDGPSRAPDEPLAACFAALAPQTALERLPRDVPTLITLGSLIGDSHASIVAVTGTAPPRATILHVPLIEHFLSMTEFAGRVVYRPEAFDSFVASVDRWLARAGS